MNSSADVYMNGKKLAHHDGGYSTWRVNLTDSLEENNFLVIAVDNSENQAVYPQMADFTFYGGIYRDVNLIAQNYNGLSNEITMSGHSTEDMLENHRILNDMAHDMDKTRLTTIAVVSMCDIHDPYIRIPFPITTILAGMEEALR